MIVVRQVRKQAFEYSAYAPNAGVAHLVMPIILGTLVSFSGVLVPYAAIQPFWRYWLYYINVSLSLCPASSGYTDSSPQSIKPFTYLIGALLWFGMWGTPVTCTMQELAIFNTPNGETCQLYLAEYLSQINPGANLLNPLATSGCQVCPYTTGTNYLQTVNITESSDGWRNVGITAIFCVSSYALVLALMKLRTKQTMAAE
jgi:ABC-type multidrug transport system permease subunit